MILSKFVLMQLDFFSRFVWLKVNHIRENSIPNRGVSYLLGFDDQVVVKCVNAKFYIQQLSW